MGNQCRTCRIEECECYEGLCQTNGQLSCPPAIKHLHVSQASFEWQASQQGADIAGKLFPETLEALPVLDRALLRFSAESNLSAVRWLMHLRADAGVQDTNGSTCLHVACRTGTLPIVCELVRSESLLDKPDVGGWTPLHVAAHQGRRKVVGRLIEARADTQQLNEWGRSPSEVCTDWGTRAIFDAAESDSLVQAVEVNHQLGADPHDCGADTYEGTWADPPFEYERCFVPPDEFGGRKAITTHGDDHARSLLVIGMHMFNEGPCFGLSFCVAGGLSNNYQTAMMDLLVLGGVNRAQLGNFLVGTMSICILNRINYFGQLELLGTGVVGALALAFGPLQLDADMQHLDVLVQNLAHAWWRAHSEPWGDQEMRKIEAANTGGMATRAYTLAEYKGEELLARITNEGTLGRLMFSTVLLHDTLHTGVVACSPEFTDDMDLTVWSSLTDGFEEGAGDADVLSQIHALVSKAPLQELTLVSPAVVELSLEPDPSHLSGIATMEGWVRVLRGAPEDDRDEIIVSEVVWDLPVNSPERGDQVWLRLCSTVLLLSMAGAEGGGPAPPSAYIDVGRLRCMATFPKKRTIALTTPTHKGATERETAVSVVHLFADGRWRRTQVGRIDIVAPSEIEFNAWISSLMKANSALTLLA